MEEKKQKVQETEMMPEDMMKNKTVQEEAAEQKMKIQEDDYDEPKVTLNPEDVLYELDVHMEAKVLYDFNLRHTYAGLQGPIATILGAMLIFFFAQGAGVIYLIAGIFVIGYLPWNLYLSAKRQALMTEAFKKPLHYAFTEEGIYVSQGEAMEMQRWEDVYLAVATSKSIIVYTSKTKASIFPRKDLGTQAVTLIEIICKHVSPKKVRIKQ